MMKIQIATGLTSGLTRDFNQVNFIEIEDKPFATGGFGEVYHCSSINGRKPQVKQVVKLFIDKGGSAEQNFETTQKLQKKISQENQDLIARQGKSLIEIYPAFKGLPQFSFRGNLNGKNVIGFTSDNLVSLGFADFEHFLQDPNLLKKYHQLPIEKKMLIAYHLVSAFKVLEDFHYIHADLKPGALFIHLNDAEIAIIDYDSGVITENVADEPLTWGSSNDWVAPEIWSQQSFIQLGEKIKVDVYSDRWSVAVGVHYLMTTFHPLFHLSELSPRVAKQYFTPQNQWPFIDKQAPYFQKANEALYDQYLPWMNSVVPKVVRDKLSFTMNFGYNNPVARTSYSDWKNALQAVQQPPVIKVFKADKSAVINNMEVELCWEVENVHTVSIDNQVGTVQKKGSMIVRPTADTQYQLTAIGYFGQAAEVLNIRVFPTPVLECLKVPMPDFKNRIELHPIQINPPIIDVSIKMDPFNRSKPAFTEPLDRIRTIKPMYLLKKELFNLSHIYESIRNFIYKSRP